jgi:hypothetical protein
VANHRSTRGNLSRRASKPAPLAHQARFHDRAGELNVCLEIETVRERNAEIHVVVASDPVT